MVPNRIVWPRRVDKDDGFAPVGSLIQFSCRCRGGVGAAMVPSPGGSIRNFSISGPVESPTKFVPKFICPRLFKRPGIAFGGREGSTMEAQFYIVFTEKDLRSKAKTKSPCLPVPPFCFPIHCIMIVFCTLGS